VRYAGAGYWVVALDRVGAPLSLGLLEAWAIPRAWFVGWQGRIDKNRAGPATGRQIDELTEYTLLGRWGRRAVPTTHGATTTLCESVSPGTGNPGRWSRGGSPPQDNRRRGLGVAVNPDPDGEPHVPQYLAHPPGARLSSLKLVAARCCSWLHVTGLGQSYSNPSWR